MSRAWAFLFLYGALTLVGAFLSFFWAEVALRRWRAIAGRWPWRRDRYFILALAIATSSFGLMLVDAARIVGNMLYGLSPILQKGEAWFIGAGLALLLIGYWKLVWLADLERSPPTFRWTKVGVIATALWLAASLALAPNVPLYPSGLEPERPAGPGGQTAAR